MNTKLEDQALTKAKIALMSSKNSAFFTTLCFSIKHSWSNKIPTACASGLDIFYNPEFFMSLTAEEQVFLLLHETLHIAFLHVERLDNFEHVRWNIACDHVINNILVAKGFKMPKGGLCDKKYKDMSSEEVYSKLENVSPPPAFHMDLSRENSSEAGSGDEMAIDSGMKDKIDSILVRARTVAEMTSPEAVGSIPAELEIYINNLVNPQIPWYRALRRYFNKAVKTNYSFRKPNRRYFPDMLLPSQHCEGIGELATATDTSGSVSQNQFDHFISEVHGLFKQVKPPSIRFLQFDTHIKSDDTVTSIADFGKVKFTGRGGTRIQPVMDWAIKNKPHVLLIFTDGYFSPPSELPNCPIIWIIHSNTKFKSPKGTVINYTFKN